MFVGYGVVAPEYGWDDYKGVDVEGQDARHARQRSAGRRSRQPGALDADVFGGKAMTYYGRWTYKYEIGAPRARPACSSSMRPVRPAIPFNVVQAATPARSSTWSRPTRTWAAPPIEGWMTLDQAKKLFQLAGQDFDALKKQAATREFKPVAARRDRVHARFATR